MYIVHCEFDAQDWFKLHIIAWLFQEMSSLNIVFHTHIFCHILSSFKIWFSVWWWISCIFFYFLQAIWSSDGSSIVYPCHAVVVAMKISNGHQRFFIGHTDKVYYSTIFQMKSIIYGSFWTTFHLATYTNSW